MENTSNALFIAVGVLIAIGIISLIVARWRQIGGFEKTKDEMVAIQNKSDFNSEYEAYNKKIMYGTDVLSCLNKAQNNNQRYVYNNYYGTDLATVGKEDREEFFIDVEVKINSPLYDTFKAYYRDNTGKYQRCIGLGTLSESDKKNYSEYDLFGSNSQTQFKDPIVDYYYFKGGVLYQKTAPYTTIMWDSSYTSGRI